MLALISGWRVCLPFCSNLIVQEIKVFRGGAIDIEPPVADKVLLIEEGSVGAEEGELCEASISIAGADVERLALPLCVCVITSIHLTVAGKRCLWNLCKDWVVLTRNSWDGLL